MPHMVRDFYGWANNLSGETGKQFGKQSGMLHMVRDPDGRAKSLAKNLANYMGMFFLAGLSGSLSKSLIIPSLDSLS